MIDLSLSISGQQLAAAAIKDEEELAYFFDQLSGDDPEGFLIAQAIYDYLSGVDDIAKWLDTLSDRLKELSHDD